MKTFNSLAMIASALLAAACGSVPTKTFRVRAVDTRDRPLVCLVVVEDDWEGAAREERYTPSEGAVPVTVRFTKEEMKVRVKAAVVGEDGTPKQAVSPISVTEHLDEFVRVRLTDPNTILFILPER